MRTIEDWYDIGFAEGVDAGTAEMITRQRDFGPHEDMLALGHRVLDGTYNPIRRRREEFESDMHGAGWMSGVQAGVASVGAWIGYTVAVDDLESGPKQDKIIYVLVTLRPVPADATIN